MELNFEQQKVGKPQFVKQASADGISAAAPSEVRSMNIPLPSPAPDWSAKNGPDGTSIILDNRARPHETNVVARDVRAKDVGLLLASSALQEFAESALDSGMLGECTCGETPCIGSCLPTMAKTALALMEGGGSGQDWSQVPGPDGTFIILDNQAKPHETEVVARDVRAKDVGLLVAAPALQEFADSALGSGMLGECICGETPCIGSCLPTMAQDALAQCVTLGKLWWNADNMQEAKEWEVDLLKRGVLAVELQPESDSARVQVLISLDRSRADAIMGYPVEESEWLDLEVPIPGGTPEEMTPGDDYEDGPSDEMSALDEAILAGLGRLNEIHKRADELRDQGRLGAQAMIDRLTGEGQPLAYVGTRIVGRAEELSLTAEYADDPEARVSETYYADGFGERAKEFAAQNAQ